MIQVKDTSPKEINRVNDVLVQRVLDRYKVDIKAVQNETFRTLTKADKLLALRTLQLYILENMK